MKWDNLTKCLEDYTVFIDEAVKAQKPYYELNKKITFTLQVNTNLFEIEFKAPEYWKYANYGRGPGKFPPPSAIESWITRRKIVPYKLSSGRTPTKSQLVYLISRKIAKKGFAGSKFLSKGLAVQADYWEDRIVEAIGEDINIEIMEWLSPLRGKTIL